MRAPVGVDGGQVSHGAGPERRTRRRAVLHAGA
jgi:hypothetical protein